MPGRLAWCLAVVAVTPTAARADGLGVSAPDARADLPRVSTQSDAGAAAPPAVVQGRKASSAPTTVTADAPELTKQTNGTYTYRGRGFDAVIDRDGTVRMHDSFVRARLTLKPMRTLSGDWVVTFFEIKYDIMGWLERKMRNDPYRSERRWFFERTHELREQLAFRAVSEKMQTLLHALWSQAGLDFAERRRRTFALWDESSEDEFGELCRGRVLDFVRERCPRNTMLGFSDEELRQLNESRRSRALFAPYDGAAVVTE